MIRRLSAMLLLPLMLGGWWLEAYEPPPAPSVSDTVFADTVLAGRVFVSQLPDSIEGHAVTRYSAERLPLTSWLLDTSFMWATTTDDRGQHSFHFDAHVQDSTLIGAWTIDVVVE